jgi:HD-GYP domain-containing protein (c-di-GMP phosphodiesterase class II)
MAAISWLYLHGRSLTEIVDALLLNETLAKVTYSMPVVIDTLIASVEERDGHLEGHMRRVCQLSVAIADELAVSDASVRAVGYASLLHDLGKLGLPPSILHKPGKLTDEEFAVLQEHPSRGFALIANVESLRIAAPAIRWHHERLDGSGYPDGLQDTEIPIEARVVAVADVWDALTSDRIYRPAMTFDEARAIVIAERGTKLDAECVDALFRILDRRAQPRAVAEARPLALATAS